MPYLALTYVCVKSYDVSMREHSRVHCQAWNTRTNSGGDPELLTAEVIRSYSGPRQYSGEGPRWNPGCCSFSTMVGNHVGILGVVSTLVGNHVGILGVVSTLVGNNVGILGVVLSVL